MDRVSASRAKRDALLVSAFFRQMRAVELDDILAAATERRVGRGVTVFAKGDAGSSLMAILAGRVRIGTMSVDGKEVTLNVMGPGEIFGEIALLDGKPRSADAVALDDSVLLVVERRHFLPLLMRHEGLAERMLVVLCDRLRQTSLALEEIALADVEARLARVVWRLASDYGRVQPGGGIRIDFKLSQRDLATLVASTRESVNKQLRVWREGGMLEFDGGYMVVTKPAALQALIA